MVYRFMKIKDFLRFLFLIFFLPSLFFLSSKAIFADHECGENLRLDSYACKYYPNPDRCAVENVCPDCVWSCSDPSPGSCGLDCQTNSAVCSTDDQITQCELAYDPDGNPYCLVAQSCTKGYCCNLHGETPTPTPTQEPTAPPGCNPCSGWVDDICGGWTCPDDEMHQTRNCDPGCGNEDRCVDDDDCESPTTGTIRGRIYWGSPTYSSNVLLADQGYFYNNSTCDNITTETAKTISVGSVSGLTPNQCDVSGPFYRRTGVSSGTNQAVSITPASPGERFHWTCSPTGNSTCPDGTTGNNDSSLNAKVTSNGTTVVNFYYTKCVITAPSVSVNVGGTTQATIGTGSILPLNYPITQVTFSTSDPDITITSPDNNGPTYETTIAGIQVGNGSATYTANATLQDGNTCSATGNVTINALGAWWQVRDADVTAAGGDISSEIPSTAPPPLYLDTNATPDFPGVPMYPGILTLGSATETSYKDWRVDSPFNATIPYSYTWFEGQLPVVIDSNGEIGDGINDQGCSGTLPNMSCNGGFFNSQGTSHRNYYWFHVGGNLTLTGTTNIDPGRRLIVLVQGDLTVNGKYAIQNLGDGFIMYIVSGKIIVDEDLPGQDTVEGIFFADGNFQTNSDGDDPQLTIRGAVAANGFSLGRTDPNNDDDTPSELFEFAPELLVQYPNVFSKRSLVWKEVAP